MSLYKYRRWTKEEDALLRDIFEHSTHKEMEKIFNRPPSKVSRRARKLGLKKTRASVRRSAKIAAKTRRKHDFSGENNPNWKGGVKITRGYKYIYSPNHPNKDSRNYVAEHRLVMEKELGRYLDGKEEIHHLDGNRLNNSVDNLVLCKDSSEHHSKYHDISGERNINKYVREKK